jgi:hypothetical protein
MTHAETNDTVYIRLNSHRARTRVKALLGRRLTHLYSFRRSAPGGIAQLTTADYQRVKHVPGVTRLRGPYDDLHPCVEQG